VSSRSALIRDLVPRYPHPAERNWHREAILACASRLAKAKPLLAAGCSSCQKWSPYFLVSSRSALIRDLVPRYPRPAERNWAPKATGIAKRYWRRRSFYWRQDVLPAKKGVPIFWCHPVVILYGILFLPDSRPQTPDQFFPIHQSLITSHQTPLFTREAILACASRLAKAKPLLAAGCSSCQKWSPYFLVSSRSALIRDLVPRYPHPAERNWHREAILACASRLAKAKPLLAAGCSSCQKWSPYFLVSSRSALIRDLVPRYPHPAERNWHREAILACASRLAKAKPLLAAGCSSCKKWSLSLFFGEAFTGGGMFFLQKMESVPIFWCHPVVLLYGISFLGIPAPRSGTGIAKRYWPAQADWRRRSLYWRRDVLPAKNGVCPYFLWETYRK